MSTTENEESKVCLVGIASQNYDVKVKVDKCQNNMDEEKVKKSGADGPQKNKTSSDDESSGGGLDSRRLAHGRRTARVHPMQDVLEQRRSGYGYDLGERNDASSINDESVSAEVEVVSNDLLHAQNRALEPLNAARDLEDAVNQEVVVAQNTEGANAANEDAAVPFSGPEHTLNSTEETHFRESAAGFAAEDEVVSVGENAENESADTGGLCQPDDEELVNLAAIRDELLNNDVDEILSENVVLASMVKDDEGEDEHSIDDGEEDDNDINAHEDIRPGAQHIYPSQPSTAEDSREDDASDVVYDLFDRPASPYLAEVIPEAVPAYLDIDFDYCVNVKSAAVVSLHKTPLPSPITLFLTASSFYLLSFTFPQHSR